MTSKNCLTGGGRSRGISSGIWLPPPFFLGHTHRALHLCAAYLHEAASSHTSRETRQTSHTSTEKSSTYTPSSGGTPCCADESPNSPLRLWLKACQVAPARPTRDPAARGRTGPKPYRARPPVCACVCVSRPSRGVTANRHNTSTSCHPKPPPPLRSLCPPPRKIVSSPWEDRTVIQPTRPE